MAYDIGESTTCFDFDIQREDRDGLILLTCAKVPEMLAAVTSEAEVRPAIEICLKAALSSNERPVDILIASSLAGPTISAIARPSA